MASTEATPTIPPQNPPITLRQPSTSQSQSSNTPTLTPPTLKWLSGSWNVTHSTLPMWKKSRNVQITYTPIPSTRPTNINDEVSYQPLDKSKSKLSTVKGVDKPFVSTPATPSHDGAAGGAGGEELASLGYTWRGKGWLMIASSKWEILGYGTEQETGNDWVVTYFAKTLFTPAGVDFYSRKGQLAPATIEGIKEAIKGLDGDVGQLGGEVFDVAWDGEREGKA